MENKYYIPDISEFYVGFEYELVDSTNKATHKVVTYDDLILTSWIDKWYDSGFIQVKYLDQEDIESLGFVKFGNMFTFKHDWHLTLHNNSKVKIFYKAPMGRTSENYFFGTIKNKSELKKVLKMINVIE